MAPSIPDRWLNYKPIGNKIEGTRFIAFKVPLKEHISKNVDSDIRLDGSILLKMVPNLGLIIDLTNTCRYYDPKFFQQEGVEHKKLMVPGQQTPSKYFINRFNSIVKEFMENNSDNDKLIGVHCTHGVNRTGFLICNYMISQMTIEPNEALDRFANARGHKIERSNYICALHNALENDVHSSSDTQTVEPIIFTERKDTDVSRKRERAQREDRSRDYCEDRSRVGDRNRNEHYRERSISPIVNSYHIYDNHNPNYSNNAINNYYSRCLPANNGGNDRPMIVLPPVPGEENLRVNNFNTYPPNLPPRIRLDYYNSRNVDQRQHNRHSKRYNPKKNYL